MITAIGECEFCYQQCEKLVLIADGDDQYFLCPDCRKDVNYCERKGQSEQG